jgi:hypothetical protein
MANEFSCNAFLRRCIEEKWGYALVNLQEMYETPARRIPMNPSPSPNPTPRGFQTKNPKQSICLSCYRTVTAIDNMTLEEANAFHARYCQGRPRFQTRVVIFPKQ